MNQNRVLSRDQILDYVWRYDSGGHAKILAPPWWAQGNEHLPATAHWIRPVQLPAPHGAAPA